MLTTSPPARGPLAAISELSEWLAPVGLFLVISIRIIAVSEGDISIARGLVAAAGPLDIALEALLDSMWTVFMLVAFISWTKATQPHWLPSPHQLKYMALYLSIVTLAILLAPVLVAIAISVFLLAHVGVSLLTYHTSDPPASPRFSSSSLLDRVDFRRQHARTVDRLGRKRADALGTADQLNALKDAVAQGSAEGHAEVPEWVAEVGRLEKELDAATVAIEEALRTAKSVDAWTPKIQRFNLVVQVAVLLFVLSSRAPWVPAEKLEFVGLAPLTGYVIEDDGPWMTILSTNLAYSRSRHPRTWWYEVSAEFRPLKSGTRH